MLIEFLKDAVLIDEKKYTDSRPYIFVRGYIIHNDELYLENEAADFIKSDYIKGHFDTSVPEYNGCWHILIYDPQKHHLVLANDRWGTYPMFSVEKDANLYVSDNWRQLLPFGNKELNEQSSFEMVSFGYVLGDKTLIDGMFDLAPHSIKHYSYHDNKLKHSSSSYWELKYTFKPADEKTKEKEFADLWQKQLKIYAHAIKKLGNACYIPMSGGLDSRLLAAEFDKHDIDIYAMTFGSFRGYDEIDAALQVVSELHHPAGHYIQYLNQETLRKLAESKNHCNRVTSSYFGQMYLDYYSMIENNCQIIMPGFSGDFLGGSLIRYRMLSWKNNQDAINYILSQRSAPMVKAFVADTKYKHYIDEALSSTFPDDADVISNYVRWFTEHDIRRYLMRSVINEKNPQGYVILPFFDYKLMDFFLELPVELLINKRLYTNTQIKYLYKHHPELIKIKRAKPRGKIHKVGNAFWTEYSGKMINKLSKSLQDSRTNSQWDKNIDWYNIYHDIELPEFMDLDLIHDPLLKEKTNYIKFFDTLSRVYKELKTC